MKKHFLATGLVSTLLLVACATANKDVANKTQVSEPAVTAAVFAPMPAFSLTKLDGSALTSAELAGKPLMVNFWHPS